MASLEAIIVKIKEESPTVKTFTLQPDVELEFHPGQYVKVELDIDGKSEKASYTIISSATKKKEFKISIENFKKANVGRKMHTLEVGDTVIISEPKGKFIVDTSPREKVFIARDIGITASLGMLQELYDHQFDKKLHLYNFLTRNFDEIYKNEIVDLQEALDLEYHRVDGSTIPKKRIKSGKLKKKHLSSLFDGLEDAEFYISGRSKFCSRLRKGLVKLGVEKSQIKKEGFG